ncbi:hypothetical protein Mapa_002308 [Marchantia paleacea]|nr:hypothetical protein Mapa_002308 [Marchantia paleacea]
MELSVPVLVGIKSQPTSSIVSDIGNCTSLEFDLTTPSNGLGSNMSSSAFDDKSISKTDSKDGNFSCLREVVHKTSYRPTSNLIVSNKQKFDMRPKNNRDQE